jgi:hypothetical protein
MSNYVYGPLSTEETGANEELIRKAQARIKAVQGAVAAEIAGKEKTIYKPGEKAPPPAITAKSVSTHHGLFSLPEIIPGEEKFFEGITNPFGIPTNSSGIPKAGATVSDAGSAAGNAAGDVAGEVASGLFGDVKEAVGADFVKGLLYVVLAGGGAALIISGVSRSTGLHPAQGAKKIAAGAATGAMLA